MSVAQTALTGINAAQTQLAVSANNIANATTPGFKPQAVERTALPGGGVRADVVELSPTARALEASQSGGDLAEISLDKEVANATLARYDVQANIKVLKTQQELDQSLLDIQA